MKKAAQIVSCASFSHMSSARIFFHSLVIKCSLPAKLTSFSVVSEVKIASDSLPHR